MFLNPSIEKSNPCRSASGVHMARNARAGFGPRPSMSLDRLLRGQGGRVRVADMPGWARVVLAAAGMGLASINGIEHSAGALDGAGGIMLFAAFFWPGANYAAQGIDNQFYPIGRYKLGWPSPRLVNAAMAQYGVGHDGFVVRHW